MTTNILNIVNDTAPNVKSGIVQKIILKRTKNFFIIFTLWELLDQLRKVFFVLGVQLVN